ncbi:MAG: GNAT family N-acetyltransferase [Candidatus Limnocylindrales bacterium]
MSVLTTDRLRLRRLTLDDTDRLLVALGDPTAMQHYPAPKDRDDVERWIRWAMESYEAQGFGLWAIERLEDGAFLGDCGPMLQPVGEAVLPEIGYHLVRHEWGHGYATEASSAALAWVFRETTHDRTCSIVSPANEPSRRVAARIHHALEMFTWERTGTEMCLYSTTRGQLDEPTLAEGGGRPRPGPARTAS